MTTFVLVPGACCGGWLWRKVVPRLRAAGHEVYTPTLTGLGERAHLAHPGVDLDTHITDVVNLLEFEDLHDVALVGHSYAGVVIAGVADRLPARLGQLMYLDATVPEDGQSYYDAEPNGDERRLAERVQAEAAGTPGYFPVPLEFMEAQVPDEAERAWVLDRMVPHPLATWVQPVRFRNPGATRLPRAYILCTEGKDPGEPEPADVARVRSEPGWRFRELPANHTAPMTSPQETAEMLLSLV